jgi:hypothetical protein
MYYFFGALGAVIRRNSVPKANLDSAAGAAKAPRRRGPS